MLVGYMRVSSGGDRQVVGLRRDGLLAAGVDERHLFEDRTTGSRSARAGLAKALAFIRPGDCLVVWKLDRLGRSLPHLLTTVTDLKQRGIAFRSLTEQMDTATPQGELLFHIFGSRRRQRPRKALPYEGSVGYGFRHAANGGLTTRTKNVASFSRRSAS